MGLDEISYRDCLKLVDIARQEVFPSKEHPSFACAYGLRSKPREFPLIFDLIVS